MTTVFFISDVVAGKNAAATRTIFDDVESAKRKIVLARRATKRRIDEASTNERPSQLPAIQTETGPLIQVSNLSKALMQAESDLMEISAMRAALEKRRHDLFFEISTLKSSMSNPSTLDSTYQADRKKAQSSSGSRNSGSKVNVRYFETESSKSIPEISTGQMQRDVSSRESELQEDLSTVVCPFELMGSCTDPNCAYMHLNR